MALSSLRKALKSCSNHTDLISDKQNEGLWFSRWLTAATFREAGGNRISMRLQNQKTFSIKLDPLPTSLKLGEEKLTNSVCVGGREPGNTPIYVADIHGHPEGQLEHSPEPG
jgi:hypothetical protein